jgi:hypothetical protein
MNPKQILNLFELVEKKFRLEAYHQKLKEKNTKNSNGISEMKYLRNWNR